MDCLNCGKELIQTPKKRPKQFCGISCRSNYWQKKKREGKGIGKAGRPKKETPSPKEEAVAEQKINAVLDAEKGAKITDKKKLVAEIRKQPMVCKEVLVRFPDEEFMGHPIPKGLKGIELSIWKAEIKEKENGKRD